MTLQLEHHIKDATLAHPSHENFDVRRNPLTGELVSIRATHPARLTSRLHALVSNAGPLAIEKQSFSSLSNAEDPLKHLQDAPGYNLQSAVHQERISTAPASVVRSAQILFEQYIHRFEELVPQPNIAELLIEEHHIAGGANALISGFSAPTHLTETINYQAERWARRRAADLLADVLVSELVDQTRVILNTAHWVAFVPYAALSPVHVMVLPKAPRRNLVGMIDAEQLELSELHQQICALLSQFLEDDAELRAQWSMAPIPQCRAVSRMRVEFLASSTGKEGIESPEQLAQRLRDLL